MNYLEDFITLKRQLKLSLSGFDMSDNHKWYGHQNMFHRNKFSFEQSANWKNFKQYNQFPPKTKRLLKPSSGQSNFLLMALDGLFLVFNILSQYGSNEILVLHLRKKKWMTNWTGRFIRINHDIFLNLIPLLSGFLVFALLFYSTRSRCVCFFSAIDFSELQSINNEYLAFKIRWTSICVKTLITVI